jgi:hypothetical protein
VYRPGTALSYKCGHYGSVGAREDSENQAILYEQARATAIDRHCHTFSQSAGGPEMAATGECGSNSNADINDTLTNANEAGAMKMNVNWAGSAASGRITQAPA